MSLLPELNQVFDEQRSMSSDQQQNPDLPTYDTL